MSTLRFFVDNSQSFSRGVSCSSSPVAIEVDPATLAQADRDAIARRLHVASGASRNAIAEEVRSLSTENGGMYSTMITAAAPTVEALLEAIREQDRLIAEIPAREAAKEAAQRAEYLGRIGKPNTSTQSVWVYAIDRGEIRTLDYEPSYSGFPDMIACRKGTWKTRSQQYLPADIASLPEAKTDDQECISWTAAQKEGAFAAAKAELQSILDARIAWIYAHGSARLKKLVAEKLGNQKVYDRERAAWEAKQYFTVPPMNIIGRS